MVSEVPKTIIVIVLKNDMYVIISLPRIKVSVLLVSE